MERLPMPSTVAVLLSLPLCVMPSGTLLAQDPGSQHDVPQGSVGVPGGPQRPETPNAPPPDGVSPMLMVGLFLVVMLFMMSRKDARARKEQAAMLASIKQGDQVVTTAGIHGTVHRLEEKTVILMLGSAQVTFDRTAIARVVRDEVAKPA
jgi:preprotein translocase subunit YajC